ncbi:C1 family peptidase [Bacteriovorax sp. Seq25_V]|uniref:C1 family peptidase n=1 Tax=Bacteriovorax sp. Seq25_V TaxID=1201288 RepID=UPI00038A19D1|nr:C1 family peptidase [Bacteriovorax sp. Seq25_V]EQC43745.1 papain family cysteine protease [Bacteriovorax sp. Seq25_V]
MKNLILLLALGLAVQNADAKIVDLKPYQSAVKNQLDRNTCAYFAITALLEGTIKYRFKKEYDISEQFQISSGKERFGQYSDKEFGNTYEIAYNFRDQYFFVKEEDAPYQTSLFEKGKICENYDPFDTTAPKVCFSHGPIDWKPLKTVKLDGLRVEWISGMWSIGKTRAQILQGHMDKFRPVAITVKVYPPGWDTANVTYTAEDDANCSNGNYECAGHAILLTGYDDEREVFFFKNSWGESWGNEGYGEISFEYINKYSDQPMTMDFERLTGNIRE